MTDQQDMTQEGVVNRRNTDEFGLIFRGRAEGFVYLGVFLPNGEIHQFREMKDDPGMFDTLGPQMFALVQVCLLGGDGVRINDLGRVQMARPIQEIIADDRLGPVTQDIWKTVVSERQFERLKNARRVAMSLEGPPPGARLN